MVPRAGMEPMYCPDCTGGSVPSGGGSTSSGTGLGCIGWILGNLFLALVFVAFWALVLVGVAVWQNMNDRPGVLAEGPSSTSWQGSYTCGDGDRGLRMELDVGEGDPADRPATALLTYLSTPPDGEAVELGTQSTTGRLRDEELSLFADEPPTQGYEIVALNARIGDDAGAMIGNVEAEGCSAFGLELRE